MQRIRLSLLAVAVLLAGGLVFLYMNPASAQETGFNGKWTVKVLSQGAELSLWMVGVDEKDKGGAKVDVLSVGFPGLKGTKVEGVEVGKDRLRFSLEIPGGRTFRVSAYAPEGDKAPKHLYGSIAVNGRRDFVRLDRTDKEKIDEEGVQATGPAREELSKGLPTKSDEDQVKLFEKVIADHPADPFTLQIITELIASQAQQAGEKTLKQWADRAVDLGARYGPEMRYNAVADLAAALVNTKNGAALALEYARQARQGLAEDAATAERAEVLGTLARALRKADRQDEAATVEAEVAKLEGELDEEFEKTNIPFQPQEFAGREGKGDRVVVLELFTGAECPPCVAADVAFDALLQSYRPKDLVLLQYHLHIPGPDALANEASEARAEYYMGPRQFTPNLFIGGDKGPSVGGGRPNGQSAYESLTEAVHKQLETPAKAAVALQGTRKGDAVELSAEVSKLQKTGKDVRLRFVLLEELVRYAGGNGQRLHHHVVRDFPGGVEGVPMAKDGGTYTASVDLGKLRKSLSDYVEDYNKKRAIPRSARPFALDHLIAVAFIQDDETKEILNAAQVDLAPGKE